MDIGVMLNSQSVIRNEVAPILVFGLAFALAVGGAFAVGILVCGWGHVNLAQVDFWKGQVKIQCR